MYLKSHRFITSFCQIEGCLTNNIMENFSNNNIYTKFSIAHVL